MLERKKRDQGPGIEARREGEREERPAYDTGAVFGTLLAEASRRGAVLVLLPRADDPPPDEGDRTRHVAARVAALGHPDLAKVLRGGEAAGRAFLLLEDLRDARTLGELLAERGAPHWKESVAIGLTVARGLAALHGSGLSRPGVALESVYVDPTWRAKLCVDAWRLALEGEPEADPLEDLRELGVLLRGLLTPEAPERLARFVGSLGDEDRARRPASAAHALSVLEGLL